jgi:uncharacterized protein YndB with AHSA1/START domain
MRIAVYVVVSLVAIVGLIALIGCFLPVKHEASRSAEFSRSPEAVWALIADPNTYSGWWSGAEVKTEVVESSSPSRLVTKIVGETAFGGTWTFEILPAANGSRLTITERGEVYNVIFRTLSRFVFGHTATIDSFLSAAQKRLGT